MVEYIRRERMSLYKYLPVYSFDAQGKKINILKYIFENKTLRFSSPLSFNDPFELRPYISEIIDEEEHLVVSKASQYINNIGKSNQFYYDNVIKPLLLDIGVLSLSETHTNLVMWAHYANNHSGIVLEMDELHPFFHTPPHKHDLLHKVRKVEYIAKRPIVNSDMWENTLLTKSKEWKYEKEYRMIILFDEEDRSTDKYNINFPPEIVKSVYIGCKAEQETIKYIKHITSKGEWRHLKIFQFDIDEKTFDLIIKKQLR